MVNNNTSSFAYVESPETLKEVRGSCRPPRPLEEGSGGLEAPISEAPANLSRLLNVEGLCLKALGGPWTLELKIC